jgi:alkylation response protein AidB-like acyl-CoA dehydrogenase
MNFDLSDEQQQLQQAIQHFLKNECPLAYLREVYESDTGFDAALWKAMAQIGIAGLQIEEQYGGGGLEFLDLALVAEVLGYGCAPGPFWGHSLAAMAIGLAGSDAQKKAWLPRLASGDAIATVALAEADAAWLPEQWQISAAGNVLTGSKQWVPYASIADLIVVGVSGGELVLVANNAAGMEIHSVQGVDRSRRIDRIDFHGTPCELLPGEAADRVRDAGLTLLAADAFGCGSRLLEFSVEYAKTREQFGVTIGHFQALKHQLANMALALEPSRGLFWYAAHAFDCFPEAAEKSAAVAKAHISDCVAQIARDSVEVHGGIGFTWECDIQFWFKRSIFNRALFGTPAVHRERMARLAGW